MLTERDLQPTPPAAETQSSLWPSPKDTQGSSLDELNPQAIENARRENAELKGHILHLRTDVERTSSSLKRLIVTSGILVVLAIVLAAAALAPPAVSSFKETEGSDKASSMRMESLVAEVTQLRTAIRDLTNGLNRQIELSRKPAEPKTAPPARATLDCANLPAARKANPIDFSIQFQAGSAQILPETEATLIGIAKLLALLPEHCVFIEGHADATGDTNKNMTLSKDRAEAVVNYISQRAGIARNRLVPLPKGSSSPAAGLGPRDAQNRRVVLRLIAEKL